MRFAFGPDNRLRIIGVVVLAATFGVGALSGAAISQALGDRPPAQRTGGGGRDRNGDRQQRRERPSIFDSLNLTSAQQMRMDSILEHGRKRTDALWREFHPRYQALLDSTRAELRANLTPEQQAEYDRRRAERRKQFEERQNASRTGTRRTDEGNH